jgi:hypothetical protein
MADLNGSKYWFNGLPVPGIDQPIDLGADKYWFNGLPDPILNVLVNNASVGTGAVSAPAVTVSGDAASTVPDFVGTGNAVVPVVVVSGAGQITNPGGVPKKKARTYVRFRRWII